MEDSGIKLAVKIEKAQIPNSLISSSERIVCALLAQGPHDSSFVFSCSKAEACVPDEVTWKDAYLVILYAVMDKHTPVDFGDLTYHTVVGFWFPLEGCVNSEISNFGQVYISLSRHPSKQMEDHITSWARENSEARMVKIFLSSTFLDMHKEREIILRKVMAPLETFCYERSVHLTYIDMRWGITDEMGDGGYTILSCLREVDHSRPYFVGLLGQRYGWHQEKDGEDTLLTKSFEIAEAHSDYPYYLLT